MTQIEIKKEHKMLLNILKDGLPYGIQLQITDVNGFTFNGELRVLSKNWCRLNITDTIKRVKVKNQTIPLNYIYIKPYLRPMSSMTTEELIYYHDLCTWSDVAHYEFGELGTEIQYNDTWESIDYLNSIHVDYRGLIPMGLAIEVTKENNPYKE